MGRPLRADEPTTFDSLAIYGSIWPPGSAMVRLDAVGTVGGFDDTLSYMEDWDFFLRLARLGGLVFIDRQVIWYRRREGGGAEKDHEKPGYLEGWDQWFQVATEAVRYKAWEDSHNTAWQRTAIARAYRRQAASFVVRQTRAAWNEFLLGRPRRVLANAAKSLYGLYLLCQWRPTRPKEQLLRALERLTKGSK